MNLSARFERWVTIGVVGLALFLDYLLYGAAIPLTPYAPGQLRHDQMGALYGWYAVSVLVVTPVFGYLGDRFGSRPTLFCGVILAGISSLSFAIGSGFFILSIAKLCQGAASAALWTSGLALVAERYTERRAEMIGYAFTGSTAGSVLGPVLAGVLHRAAGYSIPFVLVGGLFALEGFLLLLVPKGRRGSSEPVKWRTLLLNSSILAQAGFVTLAAFAWGIVEPLLPYHLESLGASVEVVGILFTVSSVLYGLSAPWVGRLSEHFGVQPIILLGLISMAVLLPLLSVPEQIVLIGGVLCLVNVSYAFILNPASAELGNAVDRAGMSCYSAVYAVYNISYSAGMIATTALATATAGTLGFRGMLVSISAVLVLCGVVAASMQIRRRSMTESSVS